MNICLLGGTYFIGRRIAAMLVAHRHEVCLVNRGRQPPVHGTTHLRADRSNVDELAQALADRSFDAIIDVSGQRPEHVVNLVEALPLLAPRIIFISSGAVYTGEKPPFGEDSPTGEGIWGAYGLAKLACEEIWEKAASASGASLLSLRPPYLYGLGNPLDRERWFVARIRDGRPIFLPDDPTIPIQFLHVDDLAQIVAGHLATTTTGPYNVAATDLLNFGRLCELTGEALRRDADVRVIDTAAHDISAREIFPFRNYPYILNQEKMERDLIENIDLLYPNTACGWVETCAGLMHCSLDSPSSERERTLIG